MADNLQVKAEKLLNYGKTQLSTKGVTSAATTVRQVLDDISDIQTGGGSGTDRLQWKCDNMKSLAYECYNSSLNNVDELFNGLDTSQVTNMTAMFYECNRLTSLDVSNFNTANVTNMRYMFNSCYLLSSLDVSNFNTANVTNMSGMFLKCRTLTSLDLSNFDTANVTEMSGMFYECNRLTSLDLSSFNTSQVTNMTTMFYECNRLTSLDVSNFNTANVTNMGSMFNGCSALTQILGSLDLIKTTALNSMFNDCTALTTFTLKNIKNSLTIGSGTSYGTLLDDATIINTAKELWDLTGTTSQTLTVATAVSAKLDTIYVKLIAATEEMIASDPNITSKKPCEVCLETDAGAMTLREYIVSKNWTISG